MKSRKIVMQIVSVCATILVLVILLAGGLAVGKEAYDFGFRIFAEPAMTDYASAKEVSVQITESMGVMDVAKLMEEKGLCRSYLLFYTQTMLSDYSKQIKPGLYILSTSMDAEQILATIAPKEAEADQEEKK